MKRLGTVLLFVFFSLAFLPEGLGQCAMCKAVAESSQEGGSAVADGLNSGIVYLMFFPYLLLGAVGYAVYRHKKRQA